MGKATFILIIGSLMLFSIYVANMNNYVLRGSEVMFDRYSAVQAKQLANSVVNIVLTELADSGNFRAPEGETISMLDGYARYRVIDTLLSPPDSVIMIDVAAVYDDLTYSVKVFTAKPGGWVPPSVRGAWTANADLNNTISDMYIDGRDHNLDGTIISGAGNFAISSTSNFTNEDEAFIGGTYQGVDYPMTFPEDSRIIEQNVDWDGAFPTTPDEMLGYPEGTLISIAKSGSDGSQYVLNPGKIIDDADLVFPLRGVTYVEIDDGVEAKFQSPTDAPGIRDEGILVFHAPDGTSRVIQMATDKKSENIFTGVIIADYSFHHHLDVLGAVLQLSDELETKHKCQGNRDHYVYYSSPAIKAATKFVSETIGTDGSYGAAVYGIGTGRKKALFWYE